MLVQFLRGTRGAGCKLRGKFRCLVGGRSHLAYRPELIYNARANPTCLVVADRRSRAQQTEFERAATGTALAAHKPTR